MNTIKVGILRETKTPPDRRVVLAPEQALEFTRKFPHAELVIQPSDYRCYKNEEYEALGFNLQEDVSGCDFLLGVKEVKIDALISDKTYLFFSHTAKKQPYNRPLLNACIDKGIALMDHEYLTRPDGSRLVAFGRWAGIVGAYNGLIAFGRRTGLFQLKRAKDCHDMEEMLQQVAAIKLPAIKILISGGGRVAQGAIETLVPLNIDQVSPEDFLNKDFENAVYCQIDPDSYVKRQDGTKFELKDFYNNPDQYESNFKPFTKVTDFYIPCHFWDQRSPVFMTKEDMREEGFKMQVIADVSCDIDGPIPSTVRASTIAEPFYGYNPFSEQEDAPWKTGMISVMAVDNLPGELPRDASADFGKALMERVFPAMFVNDSDGVNERGTLTKGGALTPRYAYLQDFADGKE